MRTHKPLIIFILMLFLSPVICAQDFSGEKAVHYIETLCGGAFRGRHTGQKGAREAAEWIGGQFKKWGLMPGGDNGSYLQPFPMLVTRQVEPARIILNNSLFGRIEYHEGNDYVLYFNSGSGTVEADVVFAGFGISEPDKGWDDYADIDVKGKIVLIHRGIPADGQDWSREDERIYKAQTAASHGAAGLLIYERREFPVRGVTITGPDYVENLPAANISRKMARDFFQGTLKNMDIVLRNLARSPQSFEMEKTALMDVKIEHLPEIKGENTVAILPGSHPVLKNEVIVIGAHMDHVGISKQNLLYPGADDNASGTAVVMELARAMAVHPEKPARTLVFAGWGAEEQGLIGSHFFAANPIFSAEQIAAKINFDMVGAGDGGGHFAGRNYFPEMIEKLISRLAEGESNKLRTSRGPGYGGSDHGPFIQLGIPAFRYSSTGDHPFFHRIEDVPETIHPDAVQYVGSRSLELLKALANHPESLLYEGNRTGRGFVLYGDQMDFTPLDKSFFSALDSDQILTLKENALRALTADICSWQSEGDNIYHAFDRFESFIHNNKHLFIFENAGSLNRSAASSGLSIAAGLRGTRVLNSDPAVLRNLARMGLKFLHIESDDDPVFSAAGLSDWGKKVIQTADENGIILSLDLGDSQKAASMYHSLMGRTIIHLPADALARVGRHTDTQNKLLLVIHTCPQTSADKLSEACIESGAAYIHLADAFSLPSAQNFNQSGFFALMQKFYDKQPDKDLNNSFNKMARLLGGSLKNFLQ